MRRKAGVGRFGYRAMSAPHAPLQLMPIKNTPMANHRGAGTARL